MMGTPTIHWFIISSIELNIASEMHVGSIVLLHLEIVTLNLLKISEVTLPFSASCWPIAGHSFMSKCKGVYWLFTSLLKLRCWSVQATRGTSVELTSCKRGVYFLVHFYIEYLHACVIEIDSKNQDPKHETSLWSHYHVEFGWVVDEL